MDDQLSVSMRTVLLTNVLHLHLSQATVKVTGY